ncbi:hypothetical protein, partial [Thiolapillus sp.]|uniref:hypothetical protein n=1 Tax=Thiolapillus sp. TaxID=2017437 RepID=UPI003AF5E680
DASSIFIGHQDLTTEHPHKLPDLLFKELLKFPSAKTANFSGLPDHLSTYKICLFAIIATSCVARRRIIRRCCLPSTPFLKKFSIRRRLSYPAVQRWFHLNPAAFHRVGAAYYTALTFAVKPLFEKLFQSGVPPLPTRF